MDESEGWKMKDERKTKNGGGGWKDAGRENERKDERKERMGAWIGSK